jgi:hypothetical protein
MPNPVTTRHTTSAMMLSAVADNSMPTVIRIRHSRIVGRRPTVSASGAMPSEPIVIPTRPVEITMPSAPGPSPHSLVMPGPANVIARMSNPSSAFSAMQMTTAII